MAATLSLQVHIGLLESSRAILADAGRSQCRWLHVPPQPLAASCHPCLPTELEFYLLHKPDRQQLLDKQAAMAAEVSLGRPPGGSIARPPVLPLPFDSHNYSGAGGFEGAATGGCYTAG